MVVEGAGGEWRWWVVVFGGSTGVGVVGGESGG